MKPFPQAAISLRIFDRNSTHTHTLTQGPHGNSDISYLLSQAPLFFQQLDPLPLGLCVAVEEPLCQLPILLPPQGCLELGLRLLLQEGQRAAIHGCKFV